MVRDLLEGFAARGWSGALDFDELTPLSADYVSEDLQRREQGLEQERALLCRLAARKFDAAAGRRLAAALAEVADAERLAAVGDWIIECGTADELLDRVARPGS